jgi:uncharacterized protein
MPTPSITALLSQWSPERLQSLFAQSPSRAASWVRVLALEGVPQAQLCYGRMLLEGTGTDENKRDALLWFQRAAAQGELDAFNMVGRCLENGWGTAPDCAAAARNYHEAADAGHAWSQYNLGHLYLDGIGVERNFASAYRYYLAAASQQHARAMSLVGRCCEEGWGTLRDLAAAADWYRRSAEAGYFRGQYNWASLLLKWRRDEEAAFWFDRAAHEGTAAVREAVLKVATSCAGSSALATLAERLGVEERGRSA